MLTQFGIFAASLIGLLVASDIFVDAVVHLARRLGVSTMVVGLTVVAIGTSLPETAAGVAAALNGHPQIAFGNVVGSNICNVGLILGLPALFISIVCDKRVLRRQGLLMIVLTAAFWAWVSWTGSIGRIEGAISILAFAAFVFWVFRSTENSPNKLGEQPWEEVAEEALHGGEETHERDQSSFGLLALKILVALVGIFVASEFLVESTVEIAKGFNVSENIIALSMIALGTSLPELSVSFAAARKREGDILVGNILGSNISNILLVLGVTASIRPFEVNPITVLIDIPLMLVFSLLMVLFLYQRSGINRSKGVLFLLLYTGVLWRCVALP